MNQTDVAMALGQFQSWVARLESGERRVDVVEFLELADVIGFDPCEVLRQVREVMQPKARSRHPRHPRRGPARGGSARRGRPRS